MDFVTVLEHARLVLAKRWRVDGTIEPYSTAKHFRIRTHALESFRDLRELLAKLACNENACIIRGKYKGEAYALEHVEDHKPGLVQRLDTLFDDPEHHWVLIEVDTFEPLGADPVTDPVGAIEEYLASLPSVFHQASYFWQLSNSAGHAKNAGKLKAHIWFWMDTPYSSGRLREWAKATKQPLDYAVFQRVQIHYTSNPVIDEGVTDPVPVRYGHVDKPHVTVPLVLADHYDMGLKATREEMLVATNLADPVAQRLYENGMVLRRGKEGQLFITCPRSDEHSGDSGETATVYYPPNTGGYANGNFKCLHAHCTDVPQVEFTRALGIGGADDFEVLDDEDVPAEAEPAKKKDTRFTPIHASEFVTAAPTEYLIKNLLPAAELIVLFGAPGAGKSFLVLDAACALARGLENWFGYRIPKKRRVAYICAEGAGGFRKRVRAYALHHDIDVASIDLFVIPATPSFLDGDDVSKLIRAMHPYGPFGLVVIDTLAKTMAGGNENSSEDMGRAISQCNLVASVLHTTVLLVHHSGKDEARGARGHNSLRGAADTELEVSRDVIGRWMHVAKQKDGEDGADRGFRLVSVTVGEDGDGDPITSCVVEQVESVRAQHAKAALSGDAMTMFRLFNDQCVAPEVGIPRTELIAMACENGPLDDAALKKHEKRMIKALDQLIAGERLLDTDGVITAESDIEKS